MDKDHYLLDVKASLISGLTSSRRCTNGIYYNDQLLSPNQELQEQFIQGTTLDLICKYKYQLESPIIVEKEQLEELRSWIQDCVILNYYFSHNVTELKSPFASSRHDVATPRVHFSVISDVGDCCPSRVIYTSASTAVVDAVAVDVPATIFLELHENFDGKLITASVDVIFTNDIYFNFTNKTFNTTTTFNYTFKFKTILPFKMTTGELTKLPTSNILPFKYENKTSKVIVLQDIVPIFKEPPMGPPIDERFAFSIDKRYLPLSLNPGDEASFVLWIVNRTIQAGNTEKKAATSAATVMPAVHGAQTVDKFLELQTTWSVREGKLSTYRHELVVSLPGSSAAQLEVRWNPQVVVGEPFAVSYTFHNIPPHESATARVLLDAACDECGVICLERVKHVIYNECTIKYIVLKHGSFCLPMVTLLLETKEQKPKRPLRHSSSLRQPSSANAENATPSSSSSVPSPPPSPPPSSTPPLPSSQGVSGALSPRAARLPRAQVHHHRRVCSTASPAADRTPQRTPSTPPGSRSLTQGGAVWGIATDKTVLELLNKAPNNANAEKLSN